MSQKVPFFFPDNPLLMRAHEAWSLIADLAHLLSFRNPLAHSTQYFGHDSLAKGAVHLDGAKKGRSVILPTTIDKINETVSWARTTLTVAIGDARDDLAKVPAGWDRRFRPRPSDPTDEKEE